MTFWNCSLYIYQAYLYNAQQLFDWVVELVLKKQNKIRMNGTKVYIIYLSNLMTKPTKQTCAHRRVRSAWASAKSDQSSLSTGSKLGSLATHSVHSEDWSDWADAQADLSLHWAHVHLVGSVMRWFIHHRTVKRFTFNFNLIHVVVFPVFVFTRVTMFVYSCLLFCTASAF